MDFNIEMRLKQLQSLDNFISYSRDKVQSILDCLHWNVEDTVKENSLIKCSIDSNHRICSNSAEAHIQKCLLQKEGYDRNEHFLSEPVNNSISSIHINDQTKVEILLAIKRTAAKFTSGWHGRELDPQTSDRLLATFSPCERLALYNYTVKNTTGPKELPEFNILQPINNQGPVLTEEETLKKERDAKRRRIKYKSVHTNHKNYVEIIREVINGQMELYSEWVNGNLEGERTDSNENSATNIEHTDKVSLNYAESTSKHSSYSGNSSVSKYNGGTHSNKRSYEYRHHSRDRDSPYHSYRNDKSHNYDNRSHRYNDSHRERSKGSYKRYRSRSRSSGHERRNRRRSRSKDKHYNRHRH